jgi:hypothetical protein
MALVIGVFMSFHQLQDVINGPHLKQLKGHFSPLFYSCAASQKDSNEIQHSHNEIMKQMGGVGGIM